MYKRDKWPFFSEEILHQVNEKLLRFVLTGLCEYLPTPAVLFIKKKGEIDCIYPAIDEMRLYPQICRHLQKKCKNLCKRDSLQRAKEFWKAPEKERETTCHLGLTIYSQKIELYGRCVAICSAGKFISTDKQRETVKRKLQELAHTCCLSISESQIDQLLDDLQKHFKEGQFKDAQAFKEKFRDSLNIVKNFLNYYASEYRKEKERKFQNQIANLLLTKEFSYPKDTETDTQKEEKALKQLVLEGLKELKDFFGLSYVALFLSDEPKDRVLELYAYEGLPSNSLKVHFNWRKAGLNLKYFNLQNWFDQFSNYQDYKSEIQALYTKGFKNKDKNLFEDMSFALPESLHLKSLLVLGPFSRPSIEIEELFQEKELKEFLFNVCRSFISQIVLVYLNNKLNKKDFARRTIVILTAHTLKSRLHHILNQLYFAKKRKDFEPLKRAEEIVITLGDQTKILMHAGDRAILRDMDPSMLNIEEIDLCALLENVVESFDEKIRDKDSLEEIKIDQSLSNLPKIQGDRDLLNLCFSDLIENAIKYSRKGKYIKIFGEHTEREVHISIQDRGHGIPEYDLKRIFEYGFQSKMPTKKYRKGLGISLAIAKNIVTIHGGDIEAKSKPFYPDNPSLKDHLLTFTVKLPITIK